MNAIIDHQTAFAPRDSGVCVHSTPAAFKCYAIFCVGNDKYREAAFRNWATQNQIGHKSMVGSYNGVTEHSFMVSLDNLELCRKWWENEDSVLIPSPLVIKGKRYPFRHASLMYVDARPTEQLGLMRLTTREYALSQPAWTLDPSTGEYWIAGGVQ